MMQHKLESMTVEKTTPMDNTEIHNSLLKHGMLKYHDGAYYLVDSEKEEEPWTRG